MPIYTYTCVTCDKGAEKMVPIKNRDDQFCDSCGYRLNRNVDRPGLVWAPTAGGMRT